MQRDYEVIVLGLGGLGSGAAYWLARQGARVLGIEQFELGHVRGASHDHSRIIRLSYHTPFYVTLAKQAYAAWAAVEADAGEQLILRTGGLDLEPANAAISLDDYGASLAAEAVPFEWLDAAEIMRRWPQFSLTPEVRGLYQAQSGIAPAARGTATHQQLARAHGAVLLDQTPVRSLRDAGGEVEVHTDGGTYRCGRLIITADAWTNDILRHLDVQLPLTITQEQVTYFASPRYGDYAPDRFPVWIWMDEPCFYGFPVYGEPAVKVAQDVGGREVTAQTRTFDPDPAILERTEQFLRRYLPSALGPIHYSKTCLYTMTPDRDFVIDTVPGHPHIAVGLGAAHGFKFASVIGRLLAGLAGFGPVDADLAPFAMDRAILLEKNPARSFLI
ncbi:MAG: N-methyl-L-tryptophan oxidase [Caldilineaceae bacterium]